ncbi:MAG: thiamine-phosphate kinase [Cyanobacteriota bacterium]|nr:thiamine-phosphate kinase [Cyanobacteriota bacterium]
MADGPTLADLGEWELIRRLGAFAPPGQFADDGALLRLSGDPSLVVNTDVLVEGLHFSDATTEAADVGWRAAVANLSDLAAMGCTEVVGLTVGLVAPASTPWIWVEGVYGGLAEALATYGGVLLGGDCSGGAQRLLAITAIGRLAPVTREQPPIAGATKERGCAPPGPIRRSDGRPGDWIVSSGPHGLSRLGLALLQAPSSPLAAQADRALRERAIQAHRRPRARLDVARALITCRPTATPWRVGGCDSSDGLAAAVRAVAAASSCGARLHRAALPLDPAMATFPEVEAWCLGGGEDFELVLALEPAWAAALVEALPHSAVIGGLVEGPAGELRWGELGGEEVIQTIGYGHFS